MDNVVQKNNIAVQNCPVKMPFKKMKKAKRNQKKNVSKDQWITKALETLESNGVEGVKIERLAKALGISRSGFYWHFKDRQDLLESILD